MSIIKRIATTLHASVDRTVASIENHDAVVAATLKDQQRAVAKANVKLRQLEATGQQQQANIDRLNQRIENWTARAKSIADTDKEKALDCLVQRQADQRLLDIAVKEHESHRHLLTRMQNQVIDLQQRISDMQTQHRDLQLRDSVSRARTQLDDVELCSAANINDTFERWEVSVEAREMESNTNALSSPLPKNLDEEFTEKENQEALQKELEALLKPAV